MTRAKRYANHKGGRKHSKDTGEELANSTHEDAAEKLAALEVFREMWYRCRDHKGYGRLKKEFLKEKTEWAKKQKHPRRTRSTELSKS
jgi:hypothetical protein